MPAGDELLAGSQSEPRAAGPGSPLCSILGRGGGRGRREGRSPPRWDPRSERPCGRCAVRTSSCSPRRRRRQRGGGPGWAGGWAPLGSRPEASKPRGNSWLASELGRFAQDLLGQRCNGPAAGASLGREPPLFACRPGCRAGHAGPCAPGPARCGTPSSGRWRRGAGPGGEVQLPAGARKGPGDKVPGTAGHGGRGEEELGADGGLWPQLPGTQSGTQWVTGSLCFLSWQCLRSQRGGHRQQD